MDKNNEAISFWEDLKSGHFTSMIKESAKGNGLSGCAEVCNIMKPIFARHDDVEKMYCIFLDAKNKILAIEKISSGSIRSASVYPRELVKMVLEKKAAAVILSHNHPTGNANPSFEDFNITVKINIALSSVDVVLHDHLVIGDGYYSFAEQGWLEKAKSKYDEFIASSKHIE